MTKQVYRSYAIAGAIFFLLAAPFAKADLQLNQAEDFAHAAYNPVNQDQELYSKVPQSDNSQDTDPQSGTMTWRAHLSCEDLTPLLHSIQYGGGVMDLGPDNVVDGRQCLLTDVNGNVRLVDNWRVQVKKTSVDPFLYGLGLCAFRVHVYCSDY